MEPHPDSWAHKILWPLSWQNSGIATDVADPSRGDEFDKFEARHPFEPSGKTTGGQGTGQSRGGLSGTGDHWPLPGQPAIPKFSNRGGMKSGEKGTVAVTGTASEQLWTVETALRVQCTRPM